ncbi:MAG TPA: ABC transporter permease [Thermoanaerobaculia bacterium]
MNNLAHDLRYAVRALMRAPGFAAVAILTLALALGANTAIFSVVRGVLLQPLPFNQPEELVRVTGTTARWSEGPFSWPNYSDIRQQNRTLDALAGFTTTSSFLYEGTEPERIYGALATADLWTLAEVSPTIGRTFTPQEDVSGQALVVVISHELWQRRFGGDPKVIGKQVRLGAEPKTVVGVMPRGFRFPVQEQVVDFWMPLGQQIEEDGGGRGAIWIDLVGRLRDGVTIEQAQADLHTIAKRLEAEYPDTNTGLIFNVDSLHDVIVRGIRPALVVLMFAVGVVLLIGCANVANLLLARAAARHREISIRSAIGATRGRIITQLLVESVLLSLLAGAAGLLLAAWGVDLLVALAPAEIPRLDAIRIDGGVLYFTLILSVLTGIVFGLAPALSASKTNLVEALKEGSRGSTQGRRRNAMRNTLVVAEIALSVFLLVGAGLLLRSFLRISGVDPGYNFENAIVIDMTSRSAAFPETEQVVEHARRTQAALRSIPGVTSVGGANHLPLGNSENVFSFSIEGKPPYPPGESPNATFIPVTPDYFSTMGIPVLRGRGITAEDAPNAPLAVVVSDSFVRQFLPGEDPIGKRVNIGDGNGIRAIVGVVGDVRFISLIEPPKPTFYVAHAQNMTRRVQYVVRSPQAATLAPTLRATVRTIDPEQPILGIQTLAQMRAESLASRQFLLVLTIILASLAVVLAAVGIYSIMSYTVAQRTSEIGIRMSLGAEARDIFKLIVGHSLRLVILGLAIGVAVALVATRVMTSLLYGVTPSDPVTFASICLLIGGIAILASYVPASRATRVDPLVAIRYD